MSNTIESTTTLHKTRDAALKPIEAVIAQNVCFKIFIVFSLFLAAIVVITGILAILASKSMLPDGMHSLSKLKVIGETNSYAMVLGGITLFILGVLAWSCQLRNENKTLR